MPQVHHVKSARKENPVAKVGEPYYWWKFRYGGKHYSKTYPKPSQLTQSEFLIQVYEIQEELDALNPEDVVDLESQVQEIASRIRDIGSEQEDKRYNMPDSLQDSENGQLLEQRAYDCEAWASELESVDFSVDEVPHGWDEDEDGEYELDRELQDVLEDVQACQYTGE
jgi:hypothetical protein